MRRDQIRACESTVMGEKHRLIRKNLVQVKIIALVIRVCQGLIPRTSSFLNYFLLLWIVSLGVQNPKSFGLPGFARLVKSCWYFKLATTMMRGSFRAGYMDDTLIR